jgi:Tol biopolymer transport system component
MLTSGTKLGPYEILEPLGTGGMGEVYKARDTRLERMVAIKILAGQLAGNPDLKSRFEREAKAISQLNHPNICSLFDVGSDVPVPPSNPAEKGSAIPGEGTRNHTNKVEFLVMEYLEGESLAERLRRGPLALDPLLKTGMQVADALEKAHRSGIIHRDLKPGNVMLTKSGAKLLDFGLAKPRSVAAATGATAPLLSAAVTMTTPSPQMSPLTSAGSIVGTIQYMSPEQIEGKEADSRSDIFAFGALLYEMATGKRAFEGKSQLSVASAILEKEPEPLTAVNAALPRELEHVTKTCLAKSPDDRFQTAHDVRLELAWVEEAARHPVSGVTPAPGVKRSAGAKMIAIALLGWLVASVAMAGGWWLWSKGQESQRPFAAEFNPPAMEGFTAAPEGPPAFSPDGTRLAFLTASPKGNVLWVRELATGRMQRVQGAEGANFIFWSPDSRNIGFFSGGQLKRIAAAGGPVQTLCAAPAGRGGAWSPNGTIVFTPSIQAGLMKINEGGGTPEKLTEPPAGTSHKSPLFLPDGEHFLFIERNLSAGTSVGMLFGMSLRGGAPKKVLQETSNVQFSRGYLLYYKGGNLVAQRFNASRMEVEGNPVAVAERIDYWNPRDAASFAASPQGTLAYVGANAVVQRLNWVDFSGRESGSVGEPSGYGLLGSTSPIKISADGSKLVASKDDPATGREDIWITDLQRGTTSRATFEDAAAVSAALSPDGNQLAVATMFKGAHARLWLQSASGSGGQTKLAELNSWTEMNQWSRDGRYIFGTIQDSKTQLDIYYIDMQDPSKVNRFLQSPASESDAMLSPNSKWLAYTSDESGKPEVYVTAFPGPGGKWQISNGGGTQARWSRDGRELFFLKDGVIQHVTVDNVESFAFGQARALLPEIKDINAFEVAADGKRLLVMRNAGQSRPPAMQIVVNWPELVK